MTKLIEKNQVTDKLIKEAARIIREGGLVAFPTETVYGLGADGLNPRAIEKIFEAKARPQDNPLILHVSSIAMAKKLTVDDLDKFGDLIDRFWPGPLTLILNKAPLVPYEATGGLETVAIRFPANDIALKFIDYSKTPLAGPSANISGRPSPTDAQTVLEDLNGRIDMILDGGPTSIGIESTVLDLSAHRPVVLRPGDVTLEELRSLYPNVSLDQALVDPAQAPKSPGQKYRHYAPKKDTYLFVGSKEEKLANIRNFVDEDGAYGYMVSEDLAQDLVISKEDVLETYGRLSDYGTIGESIFRLLRSLDKKDIDIIIVEGLAYEGKGLAIMNRLEKSSGGNIIGEKV